MPNYLSKSIHTVSLLYDSAYFEQHLKSRIQNESTFVLPEWVFLIFERIYFLFLLFRMVDSEGLTKRVVYCIYEYDPLIDSSNMSYYEYRQLAQACVFGNFYKSFI